MRANAKSDGGYNEEDLHRARGTAATVGPLLDRLSWTLVSWLSLWLAALVLTRNDRTEPVIGLND
jgi:hypothetical protein